MYRVNTKEWIDIDTTPIEEHAVQVNPDTNYMPDMRKEAQRMMDLLKSRFENFDGVNYRIQRNDHDFGPYLSIRAEYDETDMEAMEQAQFIDNNIPQRWDDTEHFRWDIVEAVNYELAVAGVEGY